MALVHKVTSNYRVTTGTCKPFNRLKGRLVSLTKVTKLDFTRYSKATNNHNFNCCLGG